MYDSQVNAQLKAKVIGQCTVESKGHRSMDIGMERSQVNVQLKRKVTSIEE